MSPVRPRATHSESDRSPTLGLLVVAVVAAFLAILQPAPALAAPAELAKACPDPIPSLGYVDVGPTSTHGRAIRCLTAWEVTTGLGDGRYGPGGNVTRAQMATFIANMIRAAGESVPAVEANQFNDVGGTHEANIEGLASLGVAQGVSQTSFDPTRPVTRAQMATFINRTLAFLGSPSPSGTGTPFTDVASGNTHVDAIGALARLGVVQGTAPETYSPNALVTRAQMASFLMRGADVLVSEAGVVVPYAPGSGGGAGTGDQSGLTQRGFPGTCPETEEIVEQLRDSTYLVAGVTEDQGREVVHPFGTAFAIGRRQLATNAHVVDGFASFQSSLGRPFTRAIAIRSGTGTVVDLMQAFNHPDYVNTNSPDVAIFTTQQQLPSVLPLAASSSVLGSNAEVRLVGFPGELNLRAEIGSWIPQATSYRGEVSARRAFDESQMVSASNLAIYQHDAPTSGGTSGSAIVHCGLVAGVHNAGMVTFVLMPGAEGEEPRVGRVPGSLSFGVHVKFLNDLRELIADGAISGTSVPPPFTPGDATGTGGDTGGTGTTDPADPATLFVMSGRVIDEGKRHSFEFAVRNDGSIVGTSQWANGDFELRGVMTNDGGFRMQDNASVVGVYDGLVDLNTGQMQGVYTEPIDSPGQQWRFEGAVMP